MSSKNNDSVNVDIKEVPEVPEVPDAQQEILEAPEETPFNIKKISELGAGNYSTVWLVKSPEFPEETLVLKQIKKRPDYEQEEPYRKLVGREINILRDLKEKCQIYSTCLIDFKEDDQFYYILTNYESDFMDLSKYIASRTTPIPPEILFNIMKNLLDALKYIHKLGIVHRDLKPANILVNPQTGEVRIIDFGLACYTYEKLKTADNQQCLASRQGSPLYISPELFRKLKPSRTNYIAGDIWALGVVFHQLLQAGRVAEYDQTYPTNYLGVANFKEFYDLIRNLEKQTPPGLNLSVIDDNPFAKVVKPMLAWRVALRSNIDQSLRYLFRVKRRLTTDLGPDPNTSSASTSSSASGSTSGSTSSPAPASTSSRKSISGFGSDSNFGFKTILGSDNDKRTQKLQEEAKTGYWFNFLSKYL